METSHLAQLHPSTQQFRFPPSMLVTLGPRPHMRTPSTLPQEDTQGHSLLAVEARSEPHAAAFQRMHTTWPTKPSRNHARDLLPAQHAGNLGSAFASACAQTLAPPSAGAYFRLNTLATSAARARSSCAGSARRGLGEAPKSQALPSPGPYFRLNTLATSAARARSSCAGSARRGSGEGWWCGRLWWRVPSPALGNVGISARSLGSGCSLNLRHTPTELKCIYYFHMKVLPWYFHALLGQQMLPDPESYAYRVGGHVDMTLYVRVLAWMLAHIPWAAHAPWTLRDVPASSSNAELLLISLMPTK